MKLSKETVISLTKEQSNIIGHMNYAAYKLWNVLNYERRNWEKLGLQSHPDWYYQKKEYKDNIWYKSLPSQSAQEVCKLLDKSWKSYFVLAKTGGIENPKPPKFKQEGIPVTYMQNGIVHEKGSSAVRLTLSKNLKSFMAEKYNIHADYLYLENTIFKNMDNIKQIKLYHPSEEKMRVIAVYEIEDVKMLEDNGHYLSIDPGINNPFTCYDSFDKCFILGKKYLNSLHYYDKKIAHYQSIYASQQYAEKVKYPKNSKKVTALYKKKKNTLNDYFHKCTRYIADYCHGQGINTVVIGDITGIRKGNDKGSAVNQQLHAFPYAQIYTMLEYKLNLYGITLIKQYEAYSSSVSPEEKIISKETADKGKRTKRGLFKDGNQIWNADAVGAYNILRLYTGKEYPKKSLSSVVKAAV